MTVLLVIGSTGEAFGILGEGVVSCARIPGDIANEIIAKQVNAGILMKRQQTPELEAVGCIKRDAILRVIA